MSESPRTLLASALRRDAGLQDEGRAGDVGRAYDDTVNALLPLETREPAVEIGFRFWEGWIDARNHDWLYYDGIGRDDWPVLARELAAHLETGAPALDPRVVEHFAPASSVSLWRRFRYWLGT